MRQQYDRVFGFFGFLNFGAECSSEINWRDTHESCKPFCSQLPCLNKPTDIINIFEKRNFVNRFLLHQKYTQNGLSTRQISKEFFCSKSTIQKYLKEENIPLREPHQHHGNPAQPKYGMKKLLGKEVPHVGEQRVIKMINDFREDGLSLRRIAKLLTKFGVPTKNHAKEWHPEMVRRLLNQNSGESKGTELRISKSPNSNHDEMAYVIISGN